MKKIISLALFSVVALLLGSLKMTAQADMGQGMMASSGTTVTDQSGKGSLNLDASAFKDNIKERLVIADGKISSLKRMVSSLPPSDKDTMKIKIAQLEGKRNTINKMMSNLESSASSNNRQRIEDAVTDLENSIKDASTVKVSQ
jgi:DNA-binding FrmR family transcriptional regulator